MHRQLFFKSLRIQFFTPQQCFLLVSAAPLLHNDFIAFLWGKWLRKSCVTISRCYKRNMVNITMSHSVVLQEVEDQSSPNFLYIVVLSNLYPFLNVTASRHTIHSQKLVRCHFGFSYLSLFRCILCMWSFASPLSSFCVQGISALFSLFFLLLFSFRFLSCLPLLTWNSENPSLEPQIFCP